MKRRGFLGFLGGAAVAGPAMAKQAVSAVGLEAMALPALPMDYGPEGYASEGIAVGGTYDHAQWLRDQISRITGISDEERRERIASQHVSILDPDLAASRSFSLAFKVQEQKRRNFDRYQKGRRRSLQRDLVEHLKSQLS